MRKEHILEFVYSEFAACGFKRVNVDDLASKMRISKKTLYEMFSNKEKLFLEAINLKSGKIIVAMSQVSEECENVLEIIIRCSMHLFGVINGVSKQFEQDIKNCHQAAESLNHIKNTLLESGKRRFDQGKHEGYLLQEADFEIVGNLLNHQVVKMTEQTSERYTPAQICFNSLIIILRGVCTEKGRAILDELQESYKF